MFHASPHTFVFSPSQSLNWIAESRLSDTTVVQTDTGVVARKGGPKTGRILLDDGGTVAHFYIDGVLVAQHEVPEHWRPS